MRERKKYRQEVKCRAVDGEGRDEMRRKGHWKLSNETKWKKQ